MLVPGTIIIVQWPVGAESADPNDHYRPWMEENVGKQCWDWNWDIFIKDGDTYLKIKFRKGTEAQAITALLRWGI